MTRTLGGPYTPVLRDPRTVNRRHSAFTEVTVDGILPGTAGADGVGNASIGGVIVDGILPGTAGADGVGKASIGGVIVDGIFPGTAGFI